MFAGEANVSKSCRIHSLPGVSCDYIFGGKAMDLLTPSGMSPSSSIGGFLLVIMIVCIDMVGMPINSLSAPSILVPFQCHPVPCLFSMTQLGSEACCPGHLAVGARFIGDLGTGV